jgi:hypothetical protein
MTKPIIEVELKGYNILILVKIESVSKEKLAILEGAKDMYVSKMIICQS